jgi:hypothetical protein
MALGMGQQQAAAAGDPDAAPATSDCRHRLSPSCHQLLPSAINYGFSTFDYRCLSHPQLFSPSLVRSRPLNTTPAQSVLTASILSVIPVRSVCSVCYVCSVCSVCSFRYVCSVRSVCSVRWTSSIRSYSFHSFCSSRSFRLLRLFGLFRSFIHRAARERPTQSCRACNGAALDTARASPAHSACAIYALAQRVAIQQP